MPNHVETCLILNNLYQEVIAEPTSQDAIVKSIRAIEAIERYMTGPSKQSLHNTTVAAFKIRACVTLWGVFYEDLYVLETDKTIGLRAQLLKKRLIKTSHYIFPKTLPIL
jgi:hypothetical protein